MKLAIFDLDHTLLGGDSDSLWGRFLVKQGVVDGDEYRREGARYMAEYRAGRLDIERHRGLGHTLVIITATNSFITAPIAAELGVDALIATEPEKHGTDFTGRVAGMPCFREGKVQKLDAWLQQADRQADETWFYSDSHNDLPLLERVDHPVAVNPDEVLTRVAAERGWPRLRLKLDTASAA